jgi:hypothetical protein
VRTARCYRVYNQTRLRVSGKFCKCFVVLKGNRFPGLVRRAPVPPGPSRGSVLNDNALPTNDTALAALEADLLHKLQEIRSRQVTSKLTYIKRIL